MFSQFQFFVSSEKLEAASRKLINENGMKAGELQPWGESRFENNLHTLASS